MAVLLEGSKGKDVEMVQTLLNTAGARPKLKTDSIFGPLTAGQTRAFQKKSKLKVDGKIGTNTMPLLKFGGPLPGSLLNRDLTDIARVLRLSNNKLALGIKNFSKVETEVAKLAQIAAREVPSAKKNFLDCQSDVEKGIAYTKEAGAKMDKFKNIWKEPAALAKKLVRDAIILDEKSCDLTFGDLGDKEEAARKSLKLVKTQMEITKKIYDSLMADIAKIKIQHKL